MKHLHLIWLAPSLATLGFVWAVVVAGTPADRAFVDTFLMSWGLVVGWWMRGIWTDS